ncbi:MAG: ribosomal RNA small subunit methyltransferase A [Alphaproteobacteria bacterium]|nr:ribosomal RNA small subunit methyltransferase A [Alphaproteobacteria bacterium]
MNLIAEDLSPHKIFELFYNKANKRFGQNFLFDEKINQKIISAAGDLTDKVVMEVGPGPGGLTLEILKQPIKKLYVVETDPHWVNVWNQLSPLFNEKLHVRHCDALNFDETSISPDVIISNLPYNISTQLLLKWLEHLEQFEQLILMFQKEVADRLYAKICTKSYGRLSVLCQWKAKVEKLFDLEPGSFFPPPKVKSTVVKLTSHTSDITCDVYKSFANLVGMAFSHRRKTVIKSLKHYSDDIPCVLHKLGYNENTRAEEISVCDFFKLFCILSGQ